MNLNPFRRSTRRNARPARHRAAAPRSAEGIRRKFADATATDAATSAQLARFANRDRSNQS
jgi:hypothetical protein